MIKKLSPTNQELPLHVELKHSKKWIIPFKQRKNPVFQVPHPYANNKDSEANLSSASLDHDEIKNMRGKI